MDLFYHCWLKYCIYKSDINAVQVYKTLTLRVGHVSLYVTLLDYRSHRNALIKVFLPLHSKLIQDLGLLVDILLPKIVSITKLL